MIETKILEQASQAIQKLYGAEPVPGSFGVEKTKKEITGD